MQNPPLDTETFIRYLLDQSDRQFREISRLKAELKAVNGWFKETANLLRPV